MESLLKNLTQHVTCSICLDTYTKPKTIACLHTFCCECLEKHALTTQTQGQFRCPECQAQVNIPEGNRFDNLPTGFLQNSLLSLLAVRRSGDESQISCANSNCRKMSAEISYCFDCGKFLCPDCVYAHELLKCVAFEGHKVKSVNRFQAEDYEAMLKRQSFCSQKYHETEVTRFFCLECKISVCQICINTHHKNHVVDPLEKAADGEKANIMAGVELMKDKKNVFIDAIRKFDETASQLETNIATAKHEVYQAAEQIIAKVRERERQTISMLENTFVSRMEEINSEKEQVQSLIKQLDQAVEFASNLVQRSSSADIMQNKKNLEQRFVDLNETGVPALPVSSFVKFVSTVEPESLSLGFMVTSETDAPLYTVDGLTENFQAGVEAEIVVRPKICGDELKVDQSKLNVGVFVAPIREVKSLIIRANESGNFQVKFIPKVPGTYKITVKINDTKLTNSPFTVQVKDRLIDVVGELDFKGEILHQPGGIAVNSKGQIAVAAVETHCILIFDKEGRFVRKFGCHGVEPGQLNSPAGVTYLNDDEILVADQLNHRIQQFNVQTGNFVKTFGKKGAGDGEFRNPVGVSVNDKGLVIVADAGNNRIQTLTTDGQTVLKFGDGGPEELNAPNGCIYHKDVFVVSDCWNHCLQVFDSSGKILHKIGEVGKADGQLSLPWGLCVEKYGNRDNLLVCDYSNGRIQQFTMEGRFSGKTITELQTPTAIATTPDGRILVSDWHTKKIYILK